MAIVPIMVMGLVMQPDSVGHLPKIHVASLVAIALHNSTGLSDLKKECPPGQVKSRVVNSDCSTSGDRRDIGYTLSEMPAPIAARASSMTTLQRWRRSGDPNPMSLGAD
jgi:hypothetical protein